MSSPAMMIAYDPVYAHPLPEGHRFPMLKYELIPGQLLYEGIIRQEQLFPPNPALMNPSFLPMMLPISKNLLNLLFHPLNKEELDFHSPQNWCTGNA